MGIHGIYKEIGPGDRIALSKLAIDKFEETGRPLRIAVDTSIWLFQIQSGKGGTNPALRTFYYRLLRLLSLSIHPLFVFDGPNKPPFKRNKRTGPNVASIPEFLAKQLLKQFGFPFHIAPGEAEAECALLQREGIVDVVLSEDVDTLMFGSRVTLRNWSPEQKSSKVPTHVNLYDTNKIKDGLSGLDREGMILVALMSGGDYLPEGIPGCGPKTACEAARAGFGRRLCAIRKKDTAALQAWREDLVHELRTNESKFFKRKHGSLSIPEDFPRADILSYYTNPAISSRDALERLKRSLCWDQDLNFSELRAFTADAFDWIKVSGAKKFIRNLAPALLVRQLRMRGQATSAGVLSEDLHVTEADEAKLVTSIHGRRQHPSTDNTPELRVAFSPIGIVDIDLDAEEPDDEPDEGEEDDEEEMAIAGDGDGDGEGTKKRVPYLYDPTKLEKIWVFETLVKVGVPLTVQDWEEAQRRKTAPKPAKVTKPRAPKTAGGGMQKGSLDRFTRITKAGAALPPAKRRSPGIDRLDLTQAAEGMQKQGGALQTASSNKEKHELSNTSTSSQRPTKEIFIIDIMSSPDASRTASGKQVNEPDIHYLAPNITNRIRTLRRFQTSSGVCADAFPSQSAAVCDASRTSPVAEDLFTSTSLRRRADEAQSLRDAQGKVQETARNRQFTSQVITPSTPSRRRKACKESNEISPSKRQATLEESFGFSRTNISSKPRNKDFVGTQETNGCTVEVEELDLSHSSPAISQAKASQPRCNPGIERSSQSTQLKKAVSSRARDDQRSGSSIRELRAPSGNSKITSKPTSAKRVPEKAPSSTASRLSWLESSPEVRRSPRQHDSSSRVAMRESSGVRRSPRQLSTSQQGQRVDGVSGKTTNGVHKKQVIKLRGSLQGSWKLVDASSVDVLDMTGNGCRKKTGGRNGERRAWRQSEVEVLDLTNG